MHAPCSHRCVWLQAKLDQVLFKISCEDSAAMQPPMCLAAGKARPGAV
ncbi:hypothetical protein [Acinetobacter sp. YH01006]|nr:hypothetical protein [Acinetobacter sp. YH01006]